MEPTYIAAASIGYTLVAIRVAMVLYRQIAKHRGREGVASAVVGIMWPFAVPAIGFAVALGCGTGVYADPPEHTLN